VIDRSQDTLLRDSGWELKNGTTTENAASYLYGATDGRLSSISNPQLSNVSFTYGYETGVSVLPSASIRKRRSYITYDTYDGTESDELLKADVLGRVRFRPEHRERMLDAFEASAMSGQAFAIHHGLKVQTFASWMQKRRRKRGDYDDEGTRQRLRMPAQSIARSQSAKPCLSLIEVCVKEDDRSGHAPAP